MALFKKGNIPWNKGIPTQIKRCDKCGQFLIKGESHICKCVDEQEPRYCIDCNRLLKNFNFERYSKRCGSCGKKLQRQKERELRKQLIQQFGGKCELCGYNKYNFCLEFHHLFPAEKKGHHFLAQIQKYPERFELLCNRCHREVEFMKKYTGDKSEGHNEKGGYNAYIKENGQRKQLEHICIHSPDSFEWGYNGSGPSDLALSILEDVTGDHNLSMRLHVPFREQYVSAWGLYWVLFEQEVLDWIDKQDHEEH